MTALSPNPLKANAIVPATPAPIYAAMGGGGALRQDDENTPPPDVLRTEKTSSAALRKMPVLGLNPEAVELPDVSTFSRYYETTISDPFQPKIVKTVPAHVAALNAKLIELSRTITSFTVRQETSEMSILGMKQFAAPTNLGLMLLGAHYFRKYDLDIVVTGSASAFEQAILAPSGFCSKSIPPKAWGIIAVQKGYTSHATPVICYKKNAAAPIQYIILDSINDPTRYVLDYFKHMNDSGSPCITFKNTGKRQLDLRGCRTDALCVLKDALRQLNTEHIEDLGAFLKAEADHDYFSNSRGFNIPAAWAKSVQNPSVLEKINSHEFIISSKAEPETLESFRKRYTLTEASRKESYTLQATLANGGTFLRTYESSVSKPQCAYLNYKGKRNFFKIQSILREKDPLLMTRFERLQAFFESDILRSDDSIIMAQLFLLKRLSHSFTTKIFE
jgi:hypothetical protein